MNQKKECTITKKDLIKISESVYEVPQSFRADMRVAARLFTNEKMLEDIIYDASLMQLVNMTTIPGIQEYAYAMPDIHQGYGFPIGGVLASSLNDGGVISPGGIGYDINCGVRLLTVSITHKDIAPFLEKLATALFDAVPSGVGRGGNISLSIPQMNECLKKGAAFMLQEGYGEQSDLDNCQERGVMDHADTDQISIEAKKRGHDQLGTLGSGNHFLEVQYVDEIFDESVACGFGLERGQVTIMIHCGSRGLGHQTCTDHVRIMMQKLPEWGYKLVDRELVYAPFNSLEGKHYYSAMAAAANYAWANRHCIGHQVRMAVQSVLGASTTVRTMYDLSHNIGTIETHTINNKLIRCIMHRKGATRAFGPGHQDIPDVYQSLGQPVLIPGTMGTGSYVMVGTGDVAFGSSCHGAGRKMSRMQAKKTVHGQTLRQQLERNGIIIRTDSDAGLAEEAPVAYKDIEEVITVTHKSGLAKKVARLRPIAVIKGG